MSVRISSGRLSLSAISFSEKSRAAELEIVLELRLLRFPLHRMTARLTLAKTFLLAVQVRFVGEFRQGIILQILRLLVREQSKLLVLNFIREESASSASAGT